MALPPGSRLPAAAQTAMVVRDPIGFFIRNHRSFGPVFRARLVGVPRIAYVATPALADLVLRTDRDIGEAGTARKDFLEPLVGLHSVLCLEGERWLQERRRLGPPFHGARVRDWSDTIAAVVAAEVATWPQGTPFGLRPRMQRITLQVMVGVALGIDKSGHTGSRDRLRALLTRLLDVGANPAFTFTPPRLRQWLDESALAQRLPANPVARFGRVKQQADALLLEEISQCRGNGTDGRHDVLSLLVAAGQTDEQIRDELVTLLEAGNETTATGIAWMFERLLRTPDVLDRAKAAVASGDETYLDAVVKESLRIRPVVMDAPRVLTAPLALDDYRVPVGWYVAPVIPLVHTDPDTYPDPERFQPERFLGDEHRAAAAWIPFGGSRRTCLGIQLALLEMRVVLTEVLRLVDLEAVDMTPERPRLRGVTIVPEHLARVTSRPRDRGAGAR